jgi:polysaccharide export outer membrane protein
MNISRAKGLLLIATVAFAVGAAAETRSSGAPAPVVATAAGGQEGYLLQPGDVLQVSVWKEADLQHEVIVRPDGGLSFPLAGEVGAAGHTVHELESALEARLKKFIPDVIVTASVKAVSGNRIYVLGKVNHPGDFVMTRPTDVMQALSLAGGTTPFADADSIRVLRRSATGTSTIAFHYSDVARGRRLDQNVILEGGDTVVVP